MVTNAGIELPNISYGLDNYDETPTVTTKTHTVREVFEALKKNGLHHLRGEWYTYNAKGKVKAACVLGQAAYNMEVPANDNSYGPTLEDQLTQFEVDPNSRWAVDQRGNPLDNVANAIISWNDAILVDERGMAQKDSHGNFKYALRYYYQVVQMAYEVLEPHFDKTINLPHYEY